MRWPARFYSGQVSVADSLVDGVCHTVATSVSFSPGGPLVHPLAEGVEHVQL